MTYIDEIIEELDKLLLTNEDGDIICYPWVIKDFLRKKIKEARLDALEEAAKEAEEVGLDCIDSEYVGADIAKAIRGLKEE